MGLHGYDPFRLHMRPGPAPVEGPLPPPICLVDDDGPYPLTHSRWLRWTAAVLAVGFIVANILTAAATTAQWSPLTDAGDWLGFEAALQRQ